MSQSGSFNHSVVPVGPVINTHQPGFSAYLSVSVPNVTGDATFYDIICDTVLFDQTSNYNNTTGIFTAPNTGKYLFVVGAFLDNMTTQSSMEVKLVTTQNSFSTKNGFQIGNGGEGIYGSFFVPMTAGDTAFIRTESAAGAKTNNLVGGNAPIFTFFQGALLF